jgi:hypothetical protein
VRYLSAIPSRQDRSHCGEGRGPSPLAAALVSWGTPERSRAVPVRVSMLADWALRGRTLIVVITRAVNSEATTRRERSSSLNFHNPFSGSLSAWSGTPAKNFTSAGRCGIRYFSHSPAGPWGSVQGFSMRRRQNEESASEPSKSLRESCSAGKYLHSSLTRRSRFCGNLNLNAKDSTNLTVQVASGRLRYQTCLV